MRIVFRCDPALRDVLPPPVPAREALPPWLRQMPRAAFSALHGQDIRTVKQCPPFVDAMSYGFVIPLPCDVIVQQGRLSWDWRLPRLAADLHPRSPISFHVPAQVEGSPFHTADRAIVKFNSFWTVELEAGWSLFATHPVNRPDLPFRLLSGIVDSDRFHDVGILFPATWADPGFDGLLPRGTPIAQCFPVPRAQMKIELDVLSDEDAAAYDTTGGALLRGPGVYRKTFRAPRSLAPEKGGPEAIEIEP